MLDKNEILIGMQMGIEFNEENLEFQDISGNSLDLGLENISVNDGVLALSWNELNSISFQKEDVLFTLEFKAKAKSKVSESIILSDKVLYSEMYDENLNTKDVELSFRSIDNLEFALLQNSPNPFSNQTDISFVLPEPGSAQLKVFDVSGKVILSKEKQFEKGLNSFVINGNELNIGGILYYQVSYGIHQQTRKMILLD